MRQAFKLLIIPSVLSAFFVGALFWHQHTLREFNARQMPEQRAAILAADFVGACLDPAREHPLTKALEEADICLRFRAQALNAAALGGLTMLLLGYVALLPLLALWAKRGRKPLARGYRWGARWAIGLGIAKSVLEPLAGAYALYEGTVLAMNLWVPKLVLGVALLGLFAAYHGVKAIVARLTIEGNEPFATELARHQAPELWADLERLARWVKTAPPEHVLVGESTSFYVTEFPVVFPKGRTRGRTLHLSRPLLAGLSREEAMAVMGHELAHFAGEDTLLTKDVSPVRARIFQVARGLEAGATTLFAAPVFNYFLETFERVHQAHSRTRELAADATGAAMTSKDAAASALVRTHVLGEAFEIKAAALAGAELRALTEEPAPKFGKEDSEAQVVSRYLMHDAHFWESLFAGSTAHPFDTHPPLRARLEALDVRWSTDSIRRWFEKEREERSAFADWLAPHQHLLEEVQGAHTEALDQVARHDELQALVRQAEASTVEGRALLERHFPKREFSFSRPRFFAGLVLLSLAALGSWATAFLVTSSEATNAVAKAVVIGLVASGFGLAFWAKRHRERHSPGTLTLSFDGLQYTGWNQRVDFSNVSRIEWLNNNGVLQGRLHFIKGVTRLERGALWPWARSSYVLSVENFSGGGEVLARWVELYHSRTLST